MILRGKPTIFGNIHIFFINRQFCLFVICPALFYSHPRQTLIYIIWIKIRNTSLRYAVDGRHPAPSNIHETLKIIGYLPYQLMQDFLNQQYETFSTKKAEILFPSQDFFQHSVSCHWYWTRVAMEVSNDLVSWFIHVFKLFTGLATYL